MQDVSGAHRRQLIRVADEHQAAARPDRVEEVRGEIVVVVDGPDDGLERTAVAIGARVVVLAEQGFLQPGMFATATVRTKVSNEGSVFTDVLAGKWVCPMHPDIVKDTAGTCDICGMPLVRAEELGIVQDSASLSCRW